MLKKLNPTRLLLSTVIFTILLTGCSGSQSPVTPLTESRMLNLTPVETNRVLWGCLGLLCLSTGWHNRSCPR